ncbi:MAG: hypothetical protein KatS3mg054_0151 [Chloroflexus sp.]|nr:MAG: hypothetical protein KatS3mg054_0151 [Chloroflexus sp.]
MDKSPYTKMSWPAQSGVVASLRKERNVGLGKEVGR